MVDRVCLENRCAFTGTGGSNPSLSANFEAAPAGGFFISNFVLPSSPPMRCTLILSSLVFFGTATIAQETTGALPWSQRFDLNVHAVPTLSAAPLDATAATMDDALRDAAGKMPLYARFVEADATLASAGTWTELPGGDRVWRLRVTSAGAHAMELFFSDTHIPNGAQVHVYTEAMDEIFGGYTAVHVQADGAFTTEMTYGDACTIEYFEPAAVRGEGSLHLDRVAHAYRMVLEEKSDACEVDVNCSEGAAWTDQRDAVVRIRVVIPSGAGFCTGTIMNNTANDCKGYILTAFHCTEESVDANYGSYQFRFRYQYPGCASGSATGSNLAGCMRRAGSQDGGGTTGSDYTLLELTSSIPASYEPYWAGWDISESGAQGGVSIHHPDSDVKKISSFTNTAVSTTWSGLTSGSHWRVNWVSTANGAGVTEPGSSGSPLFNPLKRVVGTLTGGASCCTLNGCGTGTGPNAPDYYGKISYHWWENNPNPTEEELHWWLSPIGFPAFQDGSRNPCGPIGMIELASVTPEVYPNPANDHIMVRLPDALRDADRIQVTDLTGRVVHDDRMSGTAMEIDTRNWKAGSYLLGAFSDDVRSGSVKLMVVR